MKEPKELENVKMIAVVGMNGSGKTEAVNYLTAKGHPKVYFGGMIYKEMEKRGMKWVPDGEEEKKFRAEIRRAEGKDWVVRQVIEEAWDLIDAGQRRIILDGVYSWTEYKMLKHEFPRCISVVAVVVALIIANAAKINKGEAVTPTSNIEIVQEDVEL